MEHISFWSTLMMLIDWAEKQALWVAVRRLVKKKVLRKLALDQNVGQCHKMREKTNKFWKIVEVPIKIASTTQ
jgi:hypothetical protein